MRAFVSNLATKCIPKHVFEALSHPQWKEVMINEMNALEKNQTWDLVSLPEGKIGI